MVDFTEWKDKAESLVAEHSEQIKGGVDKVGDFLESKLGAEHAGKIDAAQGKIGGFVDTIAASHQAREQQKPAGQ